MCRLSPMMMMMMTVVVTMVLLGMMGRRVEGGLLEDKFTLQVNDVNMKADAKPLVCISTSNGGVIPCDTDPRCCHRDSPRVKGTDYCCPLGSYIYHFKQGKDDVCACAMQ